MERALPANRANRLTELGVELLICGAISRPLAAILLDLGMQLIPLVSGPVEEVLAAFLGDHLDEPRFLLPGCAPNERERFLAHAARDSLRNENHSIRLRRSRGHELDLPRR
jgi:predicted Fe-Mo cluster-binding NifX family protein